VVDFIVVQILLQLQKIYIKLINPVMTGCYAGADPLGREFVDSGLSGRLFDKPNDISYIRIGTLTA